MNKKVLAHDLIMWNEYETHCKMQPGVFKFVGDDYIQSAEAVRISNGLIERCDSNSQAFGNPADEGALPSDLPRQWGVLSLGLLHFKSASWWVIQKHCFDLTMPAMPLTSISNFTAPQNLPTVATTASAVKKNRKMMSAVLKISTSSS